MNAQASRRTIVVLAMSAAPLLACSLDFDRFAPGDASAGGADVATPTADATSPPGNDAAVDTISSSDATSETAPIDPGSDAGSGDSLNVDARLGDVSRDAPGDASGDGGAPREAGSPCVAPPTCLQQATSCGAVCGQDYQQCSGNCFTFSCRQGCMSTEQSCLGRCATTCVGCTQEAGCPSTAQCLDASHT